MYVFSQHAFTHMVLGLAAVPAKGARRDESAEDVGRSSLPTSHSTRAVLPNCSSGLRLQLRRPHSAC